jgi:hypothetical protein
MGPGMIAELDGMGYTQAWVGRRPSGNAFGLPLRLFLMGSTMALIEQATKPLISNDKSALATSTVANSPRFSVDGKSLVRSSPNLRILAVLPATRK